MHLRKERENMLVNKDLGDDMVKILCIELTKYV